jgi:hypothetical protein
LLIKICAARSERSLSLFLKALPLQTLRREGGLFLKAWVFKKEPNLNIIIILKEKDTKDTKGG